MRRMSTRGEISCIIGRRHVSQPAFPDWEKANASQKAYAMMKRVDLAYTVPFPNFLRPTQRYEIIHWDS